MRYRIVAANASVGVEDGRIISDTGRFDFTLDIPDGELRPGLINAHDHLHRNHYGRLGYPPYASAYEWGRDIHVRHAEAIAQGRALDRRSAMLEGAWKNLFAGVTTVAHHDRWEPALLSTLPLHVVRTRVVHSLGIPSAADEWTGSLAPLAIHLAEGVDDEAAEEVRELERRGYLNESLLAVHVVGADDDGIARLRASGAAIVWCPTSNLFLLGRTASPVLLADGIDVLVGSDSCLTADGSLLDELRVARKLGCVSDQRLEGAVGATAARRLGLAAPSLDVGAVADLCVMRRPLLEARERDVAFVAVQGEPRVIDPNVYRLELPLSGGVAVQVDGVTRLVFGERAPERQIAGSRA